MHVDNNDDGVFSDYEDHDEGDTNLNHSDI